MEKRQEVVKWLIFSVIGVLTLIYGLIAGVKIFQYARLTEPLEVGVQSWEVVKVGNDLYQIKVAGEGYEGRLPQLFRNDHAAASSAEVLDTVTLWHRPGRKESYTLNHSFPAKACVYALIVMGLGAFVLANRPWQRERGV